MPDSLIELVIRPKPRDLGEFTVRRTLPDRRRQRVGPFIFFDHMGPADFHPGSGVNVRAHPHIGLATVTYLFDGEILHRDSLGYVQTIRPGEVNWMTAGSGIVHSEKVSDEVRDSGQHLHGLQIWVALPEAKEEIEPRFEHYSKDQVPVISLDAAEVRLVIGEAFGESSPVSTESPTLYAVVEAEAGAEIDMPAAGELAIYVVDGEFSLGSDRLEAGAMAILGARRDGILKALTPGRAVFLGGDALPGERHIWWNFVSSSAERIERAKSDWKSARFDPVPGESDFIPLPER